jgi:hypothetical protein
VVQNLHEQICRDMTLVLDAWGLDYLTEIWLFALLQFLDKTVILISKGYVWTMGFL